MALTIAQLERSIEFLSECPHPEKVVFKSQAKAKKRARQIGGMDFYQCVCGDWHLTTKGSNDENADLYYDGGHECCVHSPR